MARVKGGTISRARHKKVMKQAKGYFGSKHRLYRTAHEQVMHSGKYAYQVIVDKLKVIFVNYGLLELMQLVVKMILVIQNLSMV